MKLVVSDIQYKSMNNLKPILVILELRQNSNLHGLKALGSIINL
jgi:hypothetical protein